MPLEYERRCIDLVQGCLNAEVSETPTWLLRPGRSECRSRWREVEAIYAELTGLALPEVMRPIERRKADAVLLVGGGRPFIFEFDEVQHFNRYRAATLRHYPQGVRLGFPVASWLEQCDRKTRLEGGGFAKPRPPLFPHEDGRHRQRAFRDALCDLLPDQHGFDPTLRIGLFEVRSWLFADDASQRMTALLHRRSAL